VETFTSQVRTNFVNEESLLRNENYSAQNSLAFCATFWAGYGPIRELNNNRTDQEADIGYMNVPCGIRSRDSSGRTVDEQPL
jgi:hypothetical protein